MRRTLRFLSLSVLQALKTEGEATAIEVGELEEGGELAHDMVAKRGIGNELEVLAAIGPVFLLPLATTFLIGRVEGQSHLPLGRPSAMNGGCDVRRWRSAYRCAQKGFWAQTGGGKRGFQPLW